MAWQTSRRGVVRYRCHVEATYDGGDQTIFIGRVEAVEFGADGKQPLLYFANRYAGVKD